MISNEETCLRMQCFMFLAVIDEIVSVRFQSQESL